MLASIFVSIVRFRILFTYGVTSLEYSYFYYYSDLLLTIGLYCALMSLYAHVFEEMGAEQYVRLGAILLLLGTAAFSFAIVMQNSPKFTGRFVVEVSQNLFFVGLVLTYVLWGAILKLRETRTRLIQLVLAVGLYFSVLAATYAMRNLYPSMHNIWPLLTPISDCILPLAWAYAFWRIPDDARLAPSRLAVVPR
jgi:predicted neutral ceramidase superfamily lipid hydrolase